MEQKSHQFIKFVRKHLAQYGMKLILGRGKCVNVDGFRCSGCFDESGKAIRVARHCNQFLHVLVHEYCHFLQYINSSKVYEKSYKASNIVDGWLKGKNYAAKDVKRAFFIVRSMERDCEKRAVRLINEAASKTLLKPDLIQKFADDGSTVMSGNPEQVSKYIKAQQMEWAALIREAGIQLD